MKKFVALLLAVLLVMVNIAALADPPASETVEVPETPVTRDAPAAPSIKKTYKTTGTATDVYPTEVLKFTVTPAKDSYPTVTVGTDNQFEVDGTAGEYTIPVNVPDVGTTDGLYKAAGRYHYEVKETGAATTSQAVVYDTTTKFNVDVYVYYKVVDNVKTLVKEVVVYSGDEKTTGIAATAKTDDFKNTYTVGELKVTKAIAGSLADPQKEFTIVITLDSAEVVANNLVVDDSENENTTTGTTTKGSKTYTFTAKLKGGESVTIKKIPTGVKYTIDETGITELEDNDAATQMDNVNDPNAYYVEGQVVAADNKTISTTTASVTITNTKDITVPEGITLETLPYVLIMAIAMVGAVALFARKREEY